MRLGASPIENGEQVHDLVVAVNDGDELLRVAIPAGTLAPDGGATHFSAPAGGDVERLDIELLDNGEALLTLATVELDLSAAERTDHMVEVAVTIGTRRVTHTRLWQNGASGLHPVGADDA